MEILKDKLEMDFVSKEFTFPKLVGAVESFTENGHNVFNKERNYFNREYLQHIIGDRSLRYIKKTKDGLYDDCKIKNGTKAYMWKKLLGKPKNRACEFLLEIVNDLGKNKDPNGDEIVLKVTKLSFGHWEKA